jgi:hypothetical protein
MFGVENPHRAARRVIGLCLGAALVSLTSLRAEDPNALPRPADRRPNNELVTAKAYLSTDKLVPGKTCRVAMVVDVKEGWHINANPPSSENLVPTVLSVKSTLGSALKDVQYPKGAALRVQGFDKPIAIYEKQVKIYGTLEVPQNAAGAEEFQLLLRYQACNDTRCMAPKTITLKGTLPIARPGEPVRQINAELFPTDTRKS